LKRVLPLNKDTRELQAADHDDHARHQDNSLWYMLMIKHQVDTILRYMLSS